MGFLIKATRLIATYWQVERPIDFFLRKVYFPASQRLHFRATMRSSCWVPDSKQVLLSWIPLGCYWDIRRIIASGHGAPNTGKRSNSEATAACIIPHDPMAKKRNSNPQHRGTEVSAIDYRKIKSGIGSTRVSLRYYKRDKYNKLSPEQKKELHDWREADPQQRRTSLMTNKANDLPWLDWIPTKPIKWSKWSLLP